MSGVTRWSNGVGALEDSEEETESSGDSGVMQMTLHEQ